MERRKPRRESVVERLFKSAIHSLTYGSDCNVPEKKTEKDYSITLKQSNRKILNSDGFDMNVTDTLDEKSDVTREVCAQFRTSIDQNTRKREIGYGDMKQEIFCDKINQEIYCDKKKQEINVINKDISYNVKKQETLEDSQNTSKGESGSFCKNSIDAELRNTTKSSDIMKKEHNNRSDNLNMFRLPSESVQHNLLNHNNDQNFHLNLPIPSNNINKFNISCRESCCGQNIASSPHEVTEHVQCVRSKNYNSSLKDKSYYSSKNAADSSMLGFVDHCKTQSTHQHEIKDKGLRDSANSGYLSLSQKSLSSTYKLNSRGKGTPRQGFQQKKTCVPILSPVSGIPSTIAINNTGKSDENSFPKQKFSKSFSEGINVLTSSEERKRNDIRTSLNLNTTRTYICGHRRSISEFVRPVTSLSSMFSIYNIDSIPSRTDKRINDQSCYSPSLHQQGAKRIGSSLTPSCTYNVINQEINYNVSEKETLKDSHVTGEISAQFQTSTDSNCTKREIGHNETKQEINCNAIQKESLDNSLDTSKDKSSVSCEHSIYETFINELNKCRLPLTSDHHKLLGSNNYHDFNFKSQIHSSATDITPYTTPLYKSNMTFKGSYSNQNISSLPHEMTKYVQYFSSKNNTNDPKKETLKGKHSRVTGEISARSLASTHSHSVKKEIGYNERKQEINCNEIKEETDNSPNTSKDKSSAFCEHSIYENFKNALNQCRLPLTSDNDKLLGCNDYNFNFKSQIPSSATDVTPNTTKLNKSNMAFKGRFPNENISSLPHEIPEYVQYFSSKNNTNDPSEAKNSSQSAVNFSMPTPSYTYNSTWVAHQSAYSPSPNQQDLERIQTSLPQYVSWNLNGFKSDVGFIDSHCYLDFLFQKEKFCGTFAEYREQHRDSFPRSYKGCVAVFCNPFTFQGTMWKNFLDESNIWAAIGCHPHYSKHYDEDIDEALINALKHLRVRALGPIGLDYSNRNNSWKETQHKIFKRQLHLAVERRLPIVIHCREAHTDALNIVKKIVPPDHLIHLHCFSDKWHWAQRWLEAFPNLFIGLTNLVTFPSAKGVHEVARTLPLDRLLLETDAPYFVPRPIRKESRWSHPGMAIHVAAQIAAIKDHIPLDDVLRAVKLNTKKMYGIE